MPTTVVGLIYKLMSNNGNAIRTIAVITVLLIGIRAIKLPPGHAIDDLVKHYLDYMLCASFAGGSLLTRGVAKATKRFKKRNGPANGE